MRVVLAQKNDTLVLGVQVDVAFQTRPSAVHVVYNCQVVDARAWENDNRYC